MKARSSILSAFLTLACVAMLALPAMATTIASEIYPAAAYDSRAGVNQHLVVYLVDGEVSSPYTRLGAHIAGQFVDSLTGAAIGDPFPVSDTSAYLDSAGAEPDTAFAQTETGGVYCVTWGQDGRTGVKGVTDPQVYVQLIDADTGALVGGNLLVSSTDNPFAKSSVSVGAYNAQSENSRFMIAWTQNNGSLNEIVGTLITAGGGHRQRREGRRRRLRIR
ncbi:hypothetical protein [Desulfatibacillum aliphaticivorans]|uniref:hypothetical protein n=1 Tax=Desulfatibacillum aliphaticivorans TaxID=218208 RepID=UPI0004279398|nr:hypothetical protein [Desulfatibacillum aliphaticivorans]